MRISDWSSVVCSSDLDRTEGPDNEHHQIAYADLGKHGRLRGGGKAADENTPDTAIETLGNRTVGPNYRGYTCLRGAKHRQTAFERPDARLRQMLRGALDRKSVV